jgi:hypothetical protein
MNYYTDLFSPETFEAFNRSDRSVSGFRKQQNTLACRVSPGDRFVCYLTKLMRWVGVLEVVSGPVFDDSPLFYPTEDPFVVRFRVKPLIWLPKEKAVPIHEPAVWDSLSFTKGAHIASSTWTGVLRRSLNRFLTEDGQMLEQLLSAQTGGGQEYAVDEDRYRRLVSRRVRRADRTVAVTVPLNEEEEGEVPTPTTGVRESSKIQAILARIGEKMGFRIWLPKADRSAVQQEWKAEEGSLIDILPLNYDETTLQTIEQIDVLWLKKRSIVRAFEVEHTTAIYSGILRMADLLALQPNMNIKLHIVAPEARKEKVFTEIRRPVFSLLDQAPLSECCTFISYDSLRDLAQMKHLQHLSDSVLAEYEEEAE